MAEGRVIQIVFTAKEWMEASLGENRSVIEAVQMMSRSPWFTNVYVQTGHDNSQSINATLTPDAEVWKRRCEEARAELADLQAKVVETYNEIVRIVQGVEVLEMREV